MPGAVFLEGDQINLRTIEEEDLEFLRDGINDPDIRKWLPVDKPLNMEQQREFFEEVISSEEDVHLAICEDHEMVGIISLNDEDDEGMAQVGIWIDKDYHGNGYGTEAAKLITGYGFSELNYHKITARAYEANKASQRIWEKLGFQKEGELREQVYIDGEFGDIYLYGVLEHEWN